ncbi:putative disease resistance protein RGA4 [Dendrobium catenatum]|uniref:putative disease resistance protein RGA4 n=1 Tax=Dendrobium catenatum TaxID=906689 RepID=UPI0009F3D132|nr:putative disease resistance protein RGA4 [Dendrobium catenatum]
MEVAGWFVGPIMKKIIEACSDYLKDQLRWQTGMKEELERLRENHPKIQAVFDFAAEAQISDPALNKWIWQLRDAMDAAGDVIDELKYTMPKEHLEGDLKRDLNLKRLEKAVQKLDKVSAHVTTFLHLLDSAKQEQKEQEVDFYKTRGTGYLPKEKELVMQWLMKPSNDPGTTRCRNISVLSIVGHGGMGMTALVQHIYEDEITKEFDLKMWVSVSNKDVKEVIKDMLESLKKERPRLNTLAALQNSLWTEILSKKFLLILEDVWEDENRHISKWEKLLAPLAYGKMDSKILVTSRMDSVALTIVMVIKKKVEIVKLEGLEEDECLSSSTLMHLLE